MVGFQFRCELRSPWNMPSHFKYVFFYFIQDIFLSAPESLMFYRKENISSNASLLIAVLIYSSIRYTVFGISVTYDNVKRYLEEKIFKKIGRLLELVTSIALVLFYPYVDINQQYD